MYIYIYIYIQLCIMYIYVYTYIHTYNILLTQTPLAVFMAFEASNNIYVCIYPEPWCRPRFFAGGSRAAGVGVV